MHKITSKILLLLCGCTAFFMVMMSAQLSFFEADDLRFIWWAYQRRFEPWLAFTDPPLFAEYYRPCINLVWWLHCIILSPLPGFHHAAAGLWWLGLLGAVYLFQSKRISGGAAAATLLVLLSTDAFHHILLWKSWLTVSVSLVFQVLCLICLELHLRRQTMLSLAGWLCFLLMAVLSRESALVCLPINCLVLILLSTSATGQSKRNLLILLAVPVSVFVWNSTALMLLSERSSLSTVNIAQHLHQSMLYAENIWGNPILKVIGFAAITLQLIYQTNMRLRITGASLGVFGLAVALFYYINENIYMAITLALMIYCYTLLLSQKWRVYIFPLIWLAVSFFPLPLLRIQTITYAADASVALSLLLGIVIFDAAISTSSAIQSLPLSRFCLTISKTIPCVVLGTLFIGSLRLSVMDLNKQIQFGDRVYHTPAKILFYQMLDDVIQTAQGKPVSVQLSYRKTNNPAVITTSSMEALLYIYLHYRYNYPVKAVDSAPENAYRLSTYTGRFYERRPSNQPMNIWMHPSLTPPHGSNESDPYFYPERWQEKIHIDCNNIQNWSLSQNISVNSFPLGVSGGYVTTRITPNQPTARMYYQDTEINTDDPSSFQMTFWALANRWQNISAVEVMVQSDHQQWVWGEVPLRSVQSFSPWKRGTLSFSQADFSLDTLTNQSGLYIWFDIKTEMQAADTPVMFSVEDIRFYTKLE